MRGRQGELAEAYATTMSETTRQGIIDDAAAIVARERQIAFDLQIPGEVQQLSMFGD
jgi:hypothetical protein